MGLVFPASPANNALFRTATADGACFKYIAGATGKWAHSGGWERIQYIDASAGVASGIIVTLPADYRVFRLSVYYMVFSAADYASARISMDGGATFPIAANTCQYMMLTGGAGPTFGLQDEAWETGVQYKLTNYQIYPHGAYPNFLTMMLYPSTPSAPYNQFTWEAAYYANTIGPLMTLGFGVQNSNPGRMTHIWLLSSNPIWTQGGVLEGIRRGD